MSPSRLSPISLFLVKPLRFVYRRANTEGRGCQVRGLLPWPTASAEVGGVRCKIFTVKEEDAFGAPGTVLEAGKKGLLVACGSGSALRILELQPDGGKRMRSADYLRGHSVEVGKAL